MDILKYKKLSNNRYKVYLKDDSSIILHENIILKYNLLLTKKIDNLDELKDENDFYLLYDIALKYINIKMRCESEIRTYLKKKQIDNNVINKVINKLKEDNLINENNYVKSFVADKINLNKLGQNKIRNELLKLKIDESIINEELSKINQEDLINNLESLVDKKIKSNKTYAGDVLKQKILTDLINKGYKKEDILNVLTQKDLSNDDLYDKEYEKLYNKYSKKYSEEQLEYIIKQKLYQKGLKKNNY